MQNVNIDKRVWYAVVGVFALIFAGFTTYNLLKRPVAGGYIRIANIREFTRGKPTDRFALAQIEHGLYEKVNEFTAVKSNSVKDVKVRAGSFTQLDEADYHRVSMVVDSESLRQSYSFFYQWGDAARFEQYGGLVFCVNPEEVVFEDFKCEDMSTIQSITDPLASDLTRVLPVTAYDYEIRANILTDPPEILINIRVDSDKASDANIEGIYQSALGWLNEQGIDISRCVVRKTVSVFPVD